MVSYRRPLNRTRSTEWLLSTCLLLWGWAVLDPATKFFDMPIYVVMKSIGAEPAWGACAMTIASLRLCGLYINGWWKRTPIIRCVGASCGGMFWLAIGLCMYFGAQVSGQRMMAGTVFYAPFFVFEGWCVMSTGYDMVQEGLFGSRPPARYVAGRN